MNPLLVIGGGVALLFGASKIASARKAAAAKLAAAASVGNTTAPVIATPNLPNLVGGGFASSSPQFTAGVAINDANFSGILGQPTDGDFLTVDVARAQLNIGGVNQGNMLFQAIQPPDMKTHTIVAKVVDPRVSTNDVVQIPQNAITGMSPAK